jgi:hypothetical protein
VHPDDLKNPEYRKGRYTPFRPPNREPIHRPPKTEEAQRTQFATQAARVEFGRFYWNDELAQRMGRDLKESRRLIREAKEARRRKLNGAGR